MITSDQHQKFRQISKVLELLKQAGYEETLTQANEELKNNISMESIDKAMLVTLTESQYNTIKKQIDTASYFNGEAILSITDYVNNIKKLWQRQPFFYDKTGMFWIWDNQHHKYDMCDQIDLFNSMHQTLNLDKDSVSPKLQQSYQNMMKRYGRTKIPIETPWHWVQFGSTIYDVKNRLCFPATPQHWLTNAIPWEAKENSTERIQTLFKQWQPNKHKALEEWSAYNCLPDYPIHRIMASVGSGRNGKSQYLRFLKKFLGNHNCTSSSLDRLENNRFESARLYKKLSCFISETNFNKIKNSGILKEISGQDSISAEFKQKKPFEFTNYAKINIATNGLPVSDDQSEGWYRRWFILEWTQEFQEGKDVINEIPDSEYEGFAFKVLEVLPELLERGSFTHEGSISERKEAYEKVSNPLNQFIKECCDVGSGDEFYVKTNEFYGLYRTWLVRHKLRPLKQKEIKQKLEDEGFYVERIYVDGNKPYVFVGLKLKWFGLE